jgi:hypothetical protein
MASSLSDKLWNTGTRLTHEGELQAVQFITLHPSIWTLSKIAGFLASPGDWTHKKLTNLICIKEYSLRLIYTMNIENKGAGEIAAIYF